MNKSTNIGADILLGVAVGDALGVPVEFQKRSYIAENPVVGMRGHGSHNQPAGTWSDDTSMTMCLAECLLEGYNSERIGQSFVAWMDKAYWTAHNKVFDMGNTTHIALDKIREGHPAEGAGPIADGTQGNGSLMRILPLLFYTYDMSLNDRWDITRRASSMTHGHINCAIACFIYLEFARWMASPLAGGRSIQEMMMRSVGDVKDLFQERSNFDLTPFARVFDGSLYDATESDIRSSGYVIHTLEASLWCMLHSNNFESAVLKAVNLGEDTDTTGAVVGGLAGLRYGNIPENWLNCLARRWDIYDVGVRLEQKYKFSTWGK